MLFSIFIDNPFTYEILCNSYLLLLRSGTLTLSDATRTLFFGGTSGILRPTGGWRRGSANRFFLFLEYCTSQVETYLYWTPVFNHMYPYSGRGWQETFSSFVSLTSLLFS